MLSIEGNLKQNLFSNEHTKAKIKIFEEYKIKQFLLIRNNSNIANRWVKIQQRMSTLHQTYKILAYVSNIYQGVRNEDNISFNIFKNWTRLFKITKSTFLNL